MTRDTGRSLDAGNASHSIHHDVEIDLLAGLWETAPFARLPWDAPPELKALVEDIENPKRVYAIHRASRRHGFQQLVERFIVQLREGCGSNYCSTPTCFSFRKRSVGRIPIRRYNVTSARVLAVYMASQDNPEVAMCPALRAPKLPPAAIDSLVFYRKPSVQGGQDKTRSPGKGHSTSPSDPASKARRVRVKAKIHVRQGSTEAATATDRPRSPSPPAEDAPAVDSPKFDIMERHTGKDYRSFAANMFGTVAFKMLEWLTPNALEDMHETACDLQKDSPSDDEAELPGPPRRRGATANKFSIPEESASPVTQDTTDENTKDQETEGALSHGQHPLPNHRPSSLRRNSNTRVRTNSVTQPKRQMSIDAYPIDSLAEDGTNGLRSPRQSGIQTDKTARSIKSTTPSLPRPVAQVPPVDWFDDSRSQESSPRPTEDRSRATRDGSPVLARTTSRERLAQRTPSEISTSEISADTPEPDVEITYDSFLPQAVSVLDLDVVDFMCDVLDDDGTREQSLLEPAKVAKSLVGPSKRRNKLKRRSRARDMPRSRALKLEWKLFIEQSLFYILSDPHALIRSFTVKDELVDSQTLWYCMLRMTRVAPSLVYHCLWLSAAHLFAPPKSVQSLRSPTARLFPRQELSLSNDEAGRLMSICFHALVAAVPVASEKGQILEMSRLRAQGLSLAGKGGRSAELCLQYDDAFSHDLVMRLARRLLAAITTRRYFDDMIDQEHAFGDEAIVQPDILAPLFSQLDALSESNEEGLHETRMSTLLLDWARCVMFQEWDGSPEVPGDGPFGGALALIAAIHKKSQALRIAHKQFQSDYFADRLDNVEMPVAWLSFTSTRQRAHLLDFPCIFNSDTLVSYFRAINFSRMSHAFEDAASLKSRLDRLFDQQTLIYNPHHKNVLQDLLRTASSRYLILDIGRKTVLRDAFDQLWRREERELLRPLKVHLGEDTGEEGFDSGGVQQEFFRLAIAEALDPAFGAFTVDERNRMTWFQPGSLEPTWKFELLGLLVSLAVYNGLTLPVCFPKALYRKLLGEPVTDIHHINDGWPQIASSLTELLEWDESNGAVEDIFAVTYEFSTSMFDEHVSREMHSTTPGTQPNLDEWPQFPSPSRDGPSSLSADNPADAPYVTNANRNAYVSDYIRYMTDVSVRPQYEAFATGFRSILHPKSLTLLTPELLQNLVEGAQEIDISELRRATRYVGYTQSSRAIKDFWAIIKKYDDRMKRKLLEFVTASDRVPVGGVKNIQFVVQKNGEEEGEGGHLPTAYTCYGTLLLPEYRDREVLRERLGMALENAQGFGFA
ncbi:hypothetical protein M406DRAFT_99784 [Cryphonectria parasitica EP155]|uniref:HECT-type E3 ubiquitin transferase n=1 Tax=Cryphonectria parasitica (strain ATCC 38755 / EP155) TaxID=660469 RepID=A0A9P4XU95_CRYP1|nr:uncharacterized protein M406DRAFT_99784 [Cryphonectria parasitica EP155]KAF3761407.1 hypothetical protein M406DRAFT_99784 [Cryphonectria parasitica EP155]